MNVSILDGINIDEGAVITKEVSPYVVIGGVLAKVIKYRLEQEVIKKMLKIQWWNWGDQKLKDVEKCFLI